MVIPFENISSNNERIFRRLTKDKSFQLSERFGFVAFAFLHNMILTTTRANQIPSP